MATRSQTPEKSAALAKLLSSGTWTHDYPITFDEASRLGLKVSSAMPRDVMQLMSLYPQPLKRQRSVDYLPVRRHADDKIERRRIGNASVT